MKMKNLVAYAMLALGAVAAPFAATAADLDGHIRSINAMRSSINSCFLVWTAKYPCAKAISSLRGSPFWAIR